MELEKTNNNIMKQEIILDVIAGNYMQNKFMHAADVFEEGKQLGTHFNLNVTGENINLKELCGNMVKALEHEELGTQRQSVTFVAIRKINGKRAINPRAFIKPNVQSISDGKNWGVFKKLLEQIGYSAETTEYMQVISVKVKKNDYGKNKN